MSSSFIKPMLFGCGPFFIYPWKPILNLLFGDSYEPAYQHFVEGHYGVTNLSLHLIALGIQLTGNFGLLRVLDDKQVVPQPIEGVRTLSAISAAMWMLQLLPAPAPKSCTFGAIACIAAAYAFAPQIPKFMAYDNIAFPAFAITMVAINFLVSKKKIARKNFIKGLGILAGLYLIPRAIVETGMFASQEGIAPPIKVGYMALLSALCLLPQPTKPVSSLAPSWVVLLPTLLAMTPFST